MLRPWGFEYELIFVDDGSKDRSFEVLKGLVETDPCLRVVKFTRNFGQTYAMAAGIELSRGDVIVTMDADLQNDPRDIPRLLEELDKGYDCVSGWRERRQDRLWTRKLPSWAANWLISFVFGVELHDYGCSLKAYKASVPEVGFVLRGDAPFYSRAHRMARREGLRNAGGAPRSHPRGFQIRPGSCSESDLGRDPPQVYVRFCCSTVAVLRCYRSCCHGRGHGRRDDDLVLYRYVLALPRGRSLAACAVDHAFVHNGRSFDDIIGLIAEINIRTYYECQDKKPYMIDCVLNG